MVSGLIQSMRMESQMEEGWNRFLTERDKSVLMATPWAKSSPFGLGTRPALVVVDDYYAALGYPRMELFEAIKEWPSACGIEGWNAIDATSSVVTLARSSNIPIFFTTSFRHQPNPWNRKGPSARHRRDGGPDPYAIVEELGVTADDIIIEKSVPSAFQGTSLEIALRSLERDTVLVCGEATSGCVRATVIDACCAGFKVGIISECCFDRFEASHWMSLFDMNQKYGDLVDLEFTEQYLVNIAEGNQNAR